MEGHIFIWCEELLIILINNIYSVKFMVKISPGLPRGDIQRHKVTMHTLKILLASILFAVLSLELTDI